MSMTIASLLLLFTLLCCSPHNRCCDALEVFTPTEQAHYQRSVKEMFTHAYDGYLRNAYPYDELKPITCKGHDTWGQYSLSLIDALDTLAVMGNYSEFARAADLILENIDFNRDFNASVFETNIRVVGGLLSAHMMSKIAGYPTGHGWPCSDPLLNLAEKIARKLLPAFHTPTGMPYGTVNLRYGVPISETTITSTAGVGTFIIEFASLSRLTGDPIFERTAMRALRSMFGFRSEIGLVGNHINIENGAWTSKDSGIGAGVDSYFEYLVKGSVLLYKRELRDMFDALREPIEQYLNYDDWYMWVGMEKGKVSMPYFQSLDAFWPGLLTMIGDIDGAKKTIFNFHQIWQQYGFLPEFYNVPKGEAVNDRRNYPLRPELAESLFYLYRATRDPIYQAMGADMVKSLQHSARTACGYADINDILDHTLEDRMESFFLAETTKYLYLLFSPESFLYRDGQVGDMIETPAGSCIVNSGGWVFNTEAHPVDAAVLHCCSSKQREDLELLNMKSKIDLFADLVAPLQTDHVSATSFQDPLSFVNGEDHFEETDPLTIAHKKTFEKVMDFLTELKTALTKNPMRNISAQVQTETVDDLEQTVQDASNEETLKQSKYRNELPITYGDESGESGIGFRTCKARSYASKLSFMAEIVT